MKSIFTVLFFLLTFTVFTQDKIINNKLKDYVHQNVDSKVKAEKIYNSIIENSVKHKIDPKLVASIIKVESNFNSNSVSSAGAKGLMQLMPATAKSLKVNPTDIHSNIRGGTEYLAWCLKQNNNNISLALATYNAGYGNVKKYNGIPPFKETQKYVKKVLKEYNESLKA